MSILSDWWNEFFDSDEVIPPAPDQTNATTFTSGVFDAFFGRLGLEKYCIPVVETPTNGVRNLQAIADGSLKTDAGAVGRFVPIVAGETVFEPPLRLIYCHGQGGTIDIVGSGDDSTITITAVANQFIPYLSVKQIPAATATGLVGGY